MAGEFLSPEEVSEVVAQEARVTARLIETERVNVQRQILALEEKLVALVDKELAVVGELREGHRKISVQLDHVYGVINTHNAHYAAMSKQMSELTASNKTMIGFLSTLEKVRMMLEISAR